MAPRRRKGRVNPKKTTKPPKTFQIIVKSLSGQVCELEVVAEMTVYKLKEKLTGADQEIFFYDGVGHAFMNKSPQPYDNFEAREKVQGFPPLDEAAVDLAWSRLETFFREHLS